MTAFINFRDFMHIKKILVVAPLQMLTESAEKIYESKRKTIGDYTARKDPPHFSGDEYHAHSKIPGGYEISWSMSGKRRHPNKFPGRIPQNAQQAIADVLGVKVDILECFIFRDPETNEAIWLIEVSSS